MGESPGQLRVTDFLCNSIANADGTTDKTPLVRGTPGQNPIGKSLVMFSNSKAVSK
jgi:hypothetical protein